MTIYVDNSTVLILAILVGGTLGVILTVVFMIRINHNKTKIDKTDVVSDARDDDEFSERDIY